MRRLAFLIDADPTFALGSQVLVQRQAHMLQFVAPASFDQGEIALGNCAIAKHVVQFGQGNPLLGHDQQARCFPIKAMGQFEELCLRTGASQLLDYAKRHSAAAMHGGPRRLIHHN
jgi:hypothetical protein